MASTTTTASTTNQLSEPDLVLHLHNKLAGEPSFIPELDLYSHLPPWDIFTPTHPDQQEWFCFTPLKKKSKANTARRFDRSVAGGKFLWDNTAHPTELPHPHHPAQRRLFNFLLRRQDDGAKIRTQWSMHEYTLSSCTTTQYSSSSWAVCRVFFKHNANTKPSTSTSISTCTSASTSTCTSAPPPSSSDDDVIALQPPSKKQCCRPQPQTTPSLPLQPLQGFFFDSSPQGVSYVVQGNNLFEGLPDQHLFDALHDYPSDVLLPPHPPTLPPDPDTGPSPAPDPDPSPAPDPDPDPSPAPDPGPDPSPAPAPDPDPDPQLHDHISDSDSDSDSDSNLTYEFDLDEIAEFDNQLDNGTFFDFDLTDDDYAD